MVEKLHDKKYLTVQCNVLTRAYQSGKLAFDQQQQLILQ